MFMFRSERLCCVLMVLVSPSAGLAHDLWLVPAGKIEVGKKAVLEAAVGMDFPNSLVLPDPSTWKRRVLQPDGKELALTVAGQRGKSALLEFTPVLPGSHLVIVETQPKIITLKADAFNAYLVADGLPDIYRLRAKENSLDQPATERYSKYVKTLISAGTKEETVPTVGLPLELVPLRNPRACKVGDAFAVRVLFQGKPLPEANVGWQHPGDGESARGYVRTNDKGEAHVPIARTGLMTLRLTHMTRPKTENYEWESFWATLTFIVPN